MNILIVAATPFEVAPLEQYLETHAERKAFLDFEQGELRIKLLITGVGQMLTAYALGKTLEKEDFDLAINAGVAGAFDRELELGTVVHVVSEQLGDLGVEEADGEFKSMQELELLNPHGFPFQDAKLNNPQADAYDFLPKVSGLTVNKVHGFSESIALAKARYQADVESMEGAALFYACLMAEVPFLEIRAISNYVEPRNRDNWQLSLAIDNLNQVLIELLSTFTPTPPASAK